MAKNMALETRVSAEDDGGYIDPSLCFGVLENRKVVALAASCLIHTAAPLPDPAVPL